MVGGLSDNQFVARAGSFFFTVFFAVFFFLETLAGKLKDLPVFIGSPPSPFPFHILVNFAFRHNRLI